jgi:hypothetical protein
MMRFPRLYVAGRRIGFQAANIPPRCAACGNVHCSCSDAHWGGTVPPLGAA